MKWIFEKRRESLTGADVWRLSPRGTEALHPYFTQNQFSADGRFLALSVREAGQWRPRLLDLMTGDVEPLACPAGVGVGNLCLDGATRAAYFFCGWALYRSAPGGEAAELWRCPDGFAPGAIGISSCGRCVVFSYVEALAASTATSRIYSDQQERMFQRPRSVVMRYDAQAGRAEALHGEMAWISHVLVNPRDPDEAVFCHEGPWERVQRLWRVRWPECRAAPLLVTRPGHEMAGHEYFTAAGRVMVQYAQVDPPYTGRRTAYNIELWPDGSEERRYRLPGKCPPHLQSAPSGELHVADACHSDDGRQPPDPEAWIALVRHVEGRAEFVPLCRHGTHWRTQESHPHPIFTPDGGSVIFNADDGTGAAVYRAFVPERIIWPTNAPAAVAAAPRPAAPRPQA
jgi:oligogalacturonide lyase